MTKNNRFILASFAAVTALVLFGQPVQVQAGEDKPAQVEKKKEEKDHAHRDGDGHTHEDKDHAHKDGDDHAHSEEGHKHDEKKHKDGEKHGQE